MPKVIPFYSLEHQHDLAGRQIRAAIEKVITANHFILGSEVRKFESSFARYTGTNHCAGTASGLDALWLSLTVLGIGRGDDVIVPSHTCHPTWLAVAKTGAKIVPVEPDPLTMNIDPNAIDAVVNRKIKAIIPVHLYGQACSMKQIMSIARSNSIDVVEDNAQGHGASFGGRMTGSFGIINATSFYPTKNLGALGDAGAVTTSNSALDKKVRSLRNYGIETWSVAEDQGINSRLDELQAAVLSVKLKFVDSWNRQRAITAEKYLDGLHDTGDVQLPLTIAGATHAWHQFVIRTTHRDKLKAFLTKKGIGTMIHYPVPPHLQKAYREFGFKRGQFPEAEKIAKNCLSLPIWPGIDRTSADRVVSAIRSYFA